MTSNVEAKDLTVIKTTEIPDNQHPYYNCIENIEHLVAMAENNENECPRATIVDIKERNKAKVDFSIDSLLSRDSNRSSLPNNPQNHCINNMNSLSATNNPVINIQNYNNQSEKNFPESEMYSRLNQRSLDKVNFLSQSQENSNNKMTYHQGMNLGSEVYNAPKKSTPENNTSCYNVYSNILKDYRRWGQSRVTQENSLGSSQMAFASQPSQVNANWQFNQAVNIKLPPPPPFPPANNLPFANSNFVNNFIALKAHNTLEALRQDAVEFYKCEFCNSRFISEHYLQLHIREKHLKMIHICKFCGKPFENKENLAWHMESHESTKKKYNCKLCSKSYIKRSNYTRHLNNYHTGK